MLQQLVANSISGRMSFFKIVLFNSTSFVSFSGIADIYTTPYLEEAQITSGTLAYAMGTGKAIISTPYWYATEMLADGRGRLAPFNNPEALAEQIIDLLDNDVDRQRDARKKPIPSPGREREGGRPNYLQVFSEVRQNRTRNPAQGIPTLKISRPSPISNFRRSSSITSTPLPMIPASCSMPTIPSPIAPTATAPTTMPERCWLPPWVKPTCRQTAGGSIHSAGSIISDFFCMPSMKKQGAFAIS